LLPPGERVDAANPSGELHCFKGREPLSEMGSWNLRVLYALNGLGDPMSPLLGDREMRRALRRPLAAETIERFRSTGFAMIDKGVAGGVEVESEVDAGASKGTKRKEMAVRRAEKIMGMFEEFKNGTFVWKEEWRGIPEPDDKGKVVPRGIVKSEFKKVK